MYAHLVSRIDSEEEREKFDGGLYEPLEGSRAVLSLIEQIGG